MKKVLLLTILVIIVSAFIAKVGRMINSEDLNANYPMHVDTIDNLVVYDITDCRIDLACCHMPDSMDQKVILCAAAAFTGKCLEYFEHSNILGPHVSDGMLYQGYSENKDGIPFDERYSLFVWEGFDNQMKMLKKKIIPLSSESNLAQVVKKGGMAFTQHWVIKDGTIFKPTIQPLDRKEYFRSVCIVGDRVCIIANLEETSYQDYVNKLMTYGVDNALYMDMGSGWNHSFYRDATNKLHILHPKTHSYPTNWLVVYRD